MLCYLMSSLLLIPVFWTLKHWDLLGKGNLYLLSLKAAFDLIISMQRVNRLPDCNLGQSLARE